MKSDTLGGLLFFFMVGIGVASIFDSDWANSAWYSARYSVAFSNVQVGAKPDDCDFSRAPLGFKGCRYTKHVSVMNADGTLIAGDDAPRYSHDVKTGNPIISYNDGKSWDWYHAAFPDLKPKSVTVIWTKE